MIGKRLRKLRQSLDMTQIELADQMLVKGRTISRLENNQGDCNHQLLCTMAVYFGVTADYLLGLSDSPHPKTQTEDVILLPDYLSDEEKQWVREVAIFLLTQVEDRRVPKVDE